MIDKVLPAILEKFPMSYLDKQSKWGIVIQQNGAKSHIVPNDLTGWLLLQQLASMLTSTISWQILQI